MYSIIDKHLISREMPAYVALGRAHILGVHIRKIWSYPGLLTEALTSYFLSRTLVHVRPRAAHMRSVCIREIWKRP